MQISFLAMLALIFITLKLTSVIAWSWWLVLLPLYGGLLIWIVIMLVGVILVASQGGR